MSRIDDLIAEHCPDGVPFKSLGEVGTFVRGGGLQKKDFVDDGFPCIHYGQIYTFYGTSTTETKSFIAPELAARLKHAEWGLGRDHDEREHRGCLHGGRVAW